MLTKNDVAIIDEIVQNAEVSERTLDYLEIVCDELTFLDERITELEEALFDAQVHHDPGPVEPDIVC